MSEANSGLMIPKRGISSVPLSKVLIGIPTYKDEAYALATLVAALRAQTVQCDILIADNTPDTSYEKTLEEAFSNMPVKIIRVLGENKSDRILKSRLAIRDFFLQGDYTHIFMLDSDVILPKDAVEQLLTQNKPLVTGIYLNTFVENNKPLVAPCILIDIDGEHARQGAAVEVLSNKILAIGAAGLGCTLATRNVMQKISFRLNTRNTGEDILFYRDAIKKGFSALAVCTVQCLHMHYPVGDRRNNRFDLARYRLEQNHLNKSSS